MLFISKIYQSQLKLQEFIESYRSYNITIEENKDNYMIPEGVIELVVHIQAKTFQTNQHQSDWKKRSEAFVGGLRYKAYQIKSRRGGGLFVVRFKAGGFSHFCKFPTNIIKNELVNFEDIWGKEGLDFKEKIIEAKNDNERIRITENFLSQNYIEPKNTKFKLIIEELKCLQPNVSIDTLASKFCYSPSRFRQVFTELIGISPKEYLMVRRINQAFKEKNNSQSLTHLALKLGYFDQSHFIHHCRKVTGFNPKVFFQQDLVNSEK